MGFIDALLLLLLILLCVLVVEIESWEASSNSTSVSRTDGKTNRIDPLDKFRKYKDGYDITNKHYWSSIAFTGIYGYGIAILWLLSGLIFAAILKISKSRNPNFHNFFLNWSFLPSTGKPSFWPMIIGVFATVLILVSTSGLALFGGSKFYTGANSVKRILSETAKEASTTIHNLTEPLNNLQTKLHLYGGDELSNRLNFTAEQLEDGANEIDTNAENCVRWISLGLNILQIATWIVILSNLVFLLVLIGFFLLHRPCNMLLVICWVMTFFLWIYFGIYFFLDKFSGDTCRALKEYREDPHGSSLTALLHSNNSNISFDSTLQDTRARFHDLIDQVNVNISELKSVSSSLKFMDLGLICNPFSKPPEFKYNPEICSTNSTSLTCNSAEILMNHTCFTASIQDLLNAFPGVERLANFQLLKDAFSDVLLKQCKPLCRYSNITWASLLILSVLMFLLLLFFMLMTSIVMPAALHNYGHNKRITTLPRPSQLGLRPYRPTNSEAQLME